METYSVRKTIRDNNNRPICTETVGAVTAYTITEAMRKAAKNFNNGNWANISVQNKGRYFIFGTVIVDGYKETTYLTKTGDFKQQIEKEDLMLFNSSTKAFEYTEQKGWDLTEWDKLSNF
jgi:ribulose-5-phosphate 4-epimerase/fuculose-1-phosphate aldolase